MWSLSRVEAWLEFLGSQSTRARNLIDSGSFSSPLPLVLPGSFELFPEFRSLTDPGGFREFSSVFPGQTAIARDYLVHNWNREQEYRSLRGQLPASLGAKGFRDLRLALFSSSLDVRERALETLQLWLDEWSPRGSFLLPLSEKLEVPRETASTLGSDSALKKATSGLLLARPEDLEALRLGLEPPQLSVSKTQNEGEQSSLYPGLIPLLEEFGSALGAGAADFWAYMQATSRTSEYVDLRLRAFHPAPYFARRNYRFIQLFPFGEHGRGTAITRPQGDAASANGGTIGLAGSDRVLGAAIFWSLSSLSLARRVFEAPPENKVDWARLWIGSLLFCHLVSRACSPREERDELPSLPFEIPSLIRALLKAEGKLQTVPGNSGSLPFGFLSLPDLQQGYRRHLELREKYDFDWLLNPRFTELARSEFEGEGQPIDLLSTLSQTAFL